MDDTNNLERWRLEQRIDELTTELEHNRYLINGLENVFALRMRGLTTEAHTLLDDLQRNYVAIMRDKYPTGRP